MGHGIRERQVRGPCAADSAPQQVTISVRRYRCLECKAVITVVPAGVAPRRHFSASAIGLALYLYGALGESSTQVGQRIGLWGAGASAWRTLFRWSAAIDAGSLLRRARIRASPDGFSPRRRAERAAMTLASLSPTSTALMASRVFAGAALCS